MHFLPQLSDLTPLKTGFIVSAHRLTNITLLTLIAPLQLQGESPTYIVNEDTPPVIRAIGVSHTACKNEIRQNILSHSWCVFFVRNIHVNILHCIFQKLAHCARLSGYEENTQRTWSTTLLTGPGCLIELKHHKKRTPHVLSPD